MEIKKIWVCKVTEIISELGLFSSCFKTNGTLLKLIQINWVIITQVMHKDFFIKNIL